jgi:hypothetical protein
MSPPAAATHPDAPSLEAWGAWTPAEAADVLHGCGADWYVVGGWAIDLSIGCETREHEDLEIAMPRGGFPLIRRHLEAQGFLLFEAGDGAVRRLEAGQTCEPPNYQNWVLDPAAGVWRLDVMLQPGDADTWVFRRDERIRAPRDFMISPCPIPHLKPHGVLLYKAKAARPKDEADLTAAGPLLTREQRDWLIESLCAIHPGHAWIAALSDL